MASARKRSAIQRHRLERQHAEMMRNLAESQMKIMKVFAEEACRLADQLQGQHARANLILEKARKTIEWYYEMYADSDASKVLEEIEKYQRDVVNPIQSE